MSSVKDPLINFYCISNRKYFIVIGYASLLFIIFCEDYKLIKVSYNQECITKIQINMKLFVDYSKTKEIWNLISVGHVYEVISQVNKLLNDKT